MKRSAAMNPQTSTSDFSLPSDPVEYTLSSLARHMGQCRSAQGRWFAIRAKAEFAHALVASRLVTCGAVAALCCWALISVA